MEGRSNPKFLAARLSPPWLAPVSLLPFSHPWHPDFPAPRCSPHALVLLPSLAAPSARPCPPAELVPASGGGCVRGSLGGGRGAQLSAFVASALATESQSTVSPAPPTVMPVVASGPFVALGLLGGRGGGRLTRVAPQGLEGRGVLRSSQVCATVPSSAEMGCPLPGGSSGDTRVLCFEISGGAPGGWGSLLRAHHLIILVQQPPPRASPVPGGRSSEVFLLPGTHVRSGHTWCPQGVPSFFGDPHASSAPGSLGTLPATAGGWERG